MGKTRDYHTTDLGNEALPTYSRYNYFWDFYGFPSGILPEIYYKIPQGLFEELLPGYIHELLNRFL